MRQFLLTEADTGVAQAEIVAVVLVGIVEIVLSLHVISAAFLKKIGILQMADVLGRDRVRGDGILPGTLLSGIQGVCNIVRVGQKPDRRAEQAQRRGQYVFAFDLFTLHDVLEIYLGKERFQIIHLRCVIRTGEDQRHAAVEGVIIKGLCLVATHRRVVLCKAQRVDADLVATAARLRQDVAGEHAGVAAGDIDIQIGK